MSTKEIGSRTPEREVTIRGLVSKLQIKRLLEEIAR
jgi:hypothetical protein